MAPLKGRESERVRERKRQRERERTGRDRERKGRYTVMHSYSTRDNRHKYRPSILGKI